MGLENEQSDKKIQVGRKLRAVGLFFVLLSILQKLKRKRDRSRRKQDENF